MLDTKCSFREKEEKKNEALSNEKKKLQEETWLN